MAKVVSEKVTITFSKLVRDDSHGGSIITDDDLEILNEVADTLDETSDSRVVEIDGAASDKTE